jgi:hypothetical protein
MFDKKGVDRLRIIGSALLLSGYLMVLHGDRNLGLWLTLAGNVSVLPFSMKNKLHDVTTIQAAFASITLSSLLL